MSEFNAIHDPETGERFSIFSSQGRNLLKMYLLTYKSGGGPFSIISSGENENSTSSDDDLNKNCDCLKLRSDNKILKQKNIECEDKFKDSLALQVALNEIKMNREIPI